jgi:lysozyme family protein
MDRVAFTRRGLLISGATLSVSLISGSRVLAQDTEILGLKLPKQVLDVIPRTPLNFLRIADSVISLEREADRKGLPESPLALGKGTSLADVTDSLYQFAMPRLVALIDRSEAADLGFTDKAGELLAELHQNQHELPEALRLLSGGLGGRSPKAKGIRYFVQPEEPTSPPEIVFVPGAPPLPNLPAPAPETESESKADTQPEPPESQNMPLSRSRDYASLKPEYARMFGALEVRPQYADKANWHLEMMRRSRERYERVAAATGVPWHFIAATHGLEASFNFRAHLHNGDFPLSTRTRQVPAGRPTQWLPPSDWESSAKDALRLLGFTGQKDWSLERTLYRLEAYNGLGYRGLGVPTPYLWSFSNQYASGKYVADGKFSRTARSQQCGAAVMLKLLADAGEIQLSSAS